MRNALLLTAALAPARAPAPWRCTSWCNHFTVHVAWLFNSPGPRSACSLLDSCCFCFSSAQCSQPACSDCRTEHGCGPGHENPPEGATSLKCEIWCSQETCGVAGCEDCNEPRCPTVEPEKAGCARCAWLSFELSRRHIRHASRRNSQANALCDTSSIVASQGVMPIAASPWSVSRATSWLARPSLPRQKRRDALLGVRTRPARQRNAIRATTRCARTSPHSTQQRPDALDGARTKPARQRSAHRATTWLARPSLPRQKRRDALLGARPQLAGSRTANHAPTRRAQQISRRRRTQ